MIIKYWVPCHKFGHTAQVKDWELCTSHFVAALGILQKKEEEKTLLELIFPFQNKDFNLTGKCSNFGHGVRT